MTQDYPDKKRLQIKCACQSGNQRCHLLEWCKSGGNTCQDVTATISCPLSSLAYEHPVATERDMCTLVSGKSILKLVNKTTSDLINGASAKKDLVRPDRLGLCKNLTMSGMTHYMSVKDTYRATLTRTSA